jgi:glycosyltransferase involved in cell wall biosynthesis
MKDRYRILCVCTHPVQYASPVFRLMAADSRLDFNIAYCSMQGAEASFDQDFGREIKWDVPLLDGYSWTHVPNRAPRPGLGRFFGLVNPGLWRAVRTGNFDAVWLLAGYRYASFWIALFAAKRLGISVLFGTDASELRARDGQRWKLFAKRRFWPALFRLADIVTVPSTLGVRLMESLGVSPNRIALTPYALDNNWWMDRAARVDRAATRRSWNVPQNAPVALYCAKLQAWKRPQDLLQAFAVAAVPGAHLVFVGEGLLRPKLEVQARTLGLSNQVRFLGFMNQTQLPEVYCAADLMVLPSEYEPFGVVVNESMLCGCPVAVSDHVGAHQDLVRHRQNGFVFPVGDVNALATILKENLAATDRLRLFGAAARLRMQSWSPTESTESLVRALERATAFREKRETRKSN